MDVNGEAIYGTRAARELVLPEGVRATRKGRTVYLFCTGYSGEEFRVSGGGFINGAKAQLLGAVCRSSASVRETPSVLKAPPLTAGECPAATSALLKYRG